VEGGGACGRKEGRGKMKLLGMRLLMVWRELWVEVDGDFCGGGRGVLGESTRMLFGIFRHVGAWRGEHFTGSRSPVEVTAIEGGLLKDHLIEFSPS
jgi:hypothetical protein